MEKAILKTLIYGDIFDYPLKVYEIHKWLIGRKSTLRQVEKALKSLGNVVSSKYYGEDKYYFLSKRDGLVRKRVQRQKQSKVYFRKAKVICQLLKIIPWIKLVGVSGGLAMENASKKDDIDLFVVTAKNRMWISRLLALGLLSLTGQRRKAGEKGQKIAGKLCLNILLEEDKLTQNSKDIYLAHEVLQMRVLWQRENIYSKYLEDNSWAFKYLPNWMSTTGFKPRDTRGTLIPRDTFRLWLESLARKFQLWYMKQPKGMERIENGALYFHPKDCRPQILALYRQKVKNLSTS